MPAGTFSVKAFSAITAEYFWPLPEDVNWIALPLMSPPDIVPVTSHNVAGSILIKLI